MTTNINLHKSLLTRGFLFAVKRHITLKKYISLLLVKTQIIVYNLYIVIMGKFVMKFQSKSAFAYIMRNFWRLVYVALPIAVLLAFFANPSGEIEFLHTLIAGELTLDNVFLVFNNAYTVLRFGSLWWTDVIAFTVLALTISMLIVKISRHMRVGVMPALPFKKTFALFPTTFLLLLSYFCVSEIAMLLSVGIMYIIRAVNNATAIAAVGFAVAFVVRLIIVWIFMLLILALPLKYSENYSLNVGMSYSVRVMTKLPKQVWAITLVCSFGRYVMMLCAYFLRPYYVDVVLYALIYLAVILYLPVYAYKVYHDVVGGERRDVTEIIFNWEGTK